MNTKQTRNVEKTKARILKAAEALLTREGIGGFQVNALAEEAGIGKPLIYRYFGGLDGVFEKLVSRLSEEARLQVAAFSIPKGISLSKDTYNQLLFGRMLAGSSDLRRLFKCLLAGDLNANQRNLLLGILPKIVSEETGSDHKAGQAFLLAGICFIVLVADCSSTWGGVRLDQANDRGRLEKVFVDLAKSLDW